MRVMQTAVRLAIGSAALWLLAMTALSVHVHVKGSGDRGAPVQLASD